MVRSQMRGGRNRDARASICRHGAHGPCLDVMPAATMTGSSDIGARVSCQPVSIILINDGGYRKGLCPRLSDETLVVGSSAISQDFS